MTGTLTFIGTATTLIEYGGFTLLTDPNFLHRGQKAYLGKGLFSTRRTEPAMQVHELPPLDAVVLSHLHDDHFDRIARDGLPKETTIITTRAAADTLRSWGFSQAVALETWQTHELRSGAGDVLRVSAAPGRHARGPLQALLPPVHGHVLQYSPVTDPAMSVYITGDTLNVDELRQVPERHPDLGLGVLVTMDAREGADLLELVRPRTTVPIHHDDYGVFTSPLSDFLAEVGRRGLTGVRPLERGQVLSLPPEPSTG